MSRPRIIALLAHLRENSMFWATSVLQSVFKSYLKASNGPIWDTQRQYWPAQTLTTINLDLNWRLSTHGINGNYKNSIAFTSLWINCHLRSCKLKVANSRAWILASCCLRSDHSSYFLHHSRSASFVCSFVPCCPVISFENRLSGGAKLFALLPPPLRSPSIAGLRLWELQCGCTTTASTGALRSNLSRSPALRGSSRESGCQPLSSTAKGAPSIFLTRSTTPPHRLSQIRRAKHSRYASQIISSSAHVKTHTRKQSGLAMFLSFTSLLLLVSFSSQW